MTYWRHDEILRRQYIKLPCSPSTLSECFNELFALAKNIVTKQIANMRDARREN